jgi:arylmalonate decarboxylase
VPDGTQSGRKQTIAWLKPGGVDRIETDVFAMTPPDVNLKIFTSTLSKYMMERPEFDPGPFNGALRDLILESVRDVAETVHPNYVAVTGDLIQAAMGYKWDSALREDIRAAAGVDATTAMTAVTDALTHLGARRVAVATPYREEQYSNFKRYLEDAGFEVTAIAGCPTHSIGEVKALPAGTPLRLGKEVFAMDTRADALYVACPLWRVSPYIAPLEEAIGVTVLTVMGAFIWNGLRAIGHPGGVQGYGRLLEKVSGPS